MRSTPRRRRRQRRPAVEQKADAGLRKQELEQARIDFERAEDEYKRMKFLVERKSLPPNDFQKIEAAYKAAKERYDMAQEGTRKEDRAAATAQAHAADAQATEERKRLNDTRLVAPISGSISACEESTRGRRSPPGWRSSPSSNSTRSKSAWEFRKPKSEKSTKAPRRRSPLPSLDGRRFTGKVAIIGVAAEPASRTYTVKILVPNPGPVLLAGMVAEARIFGPAKIRVVDHPRRGGRARSTGRAQCVRLLPGPQACLRAKGRGRPAGRQ